MNKKILSLVLAICLILSMMPMASATQDGFSIGAEEDTSSQPATGDVRLVTPGNTDDNLWASDLPDTAGDDAEVTWDGKGNSVTLVDSVPDFKDLYAENGLNRVSPSKTYNPGDEVTFIVVTKNTPLLDAGFSTREIGDQAASVMSAQKTLKENISTVQAKAENALKNDVNYEKGFVYTIATAGFSVKASYGSKATLEALPGVDHVYIAPVFSIPNDDATVLYNANTLQPLSGDAREMIGVSSEAASDYTGKGMRIAIIDTGIVQDHPSFQALPESALTDTSLTAAEVDEVWHNLHASETSVTYLSHAYYNTKIPYKFNYATGSYDVAHTGSTGDHGSHVAGIAAANRTDGTTVQGIAPDAQLLVLQVFSGMGASWDVVMAAMEDAVMLGADSVNMSLGMDAGFSSDDDDMAAVIKKYSESDTILLIAAGNAGNSAAGNNYGYNLSLTSNPDVGMMSVPAAYDGAVAVASTNKNRRTMNYFTLEDGTEIGFTDTATSDASRFVTVLSGEDKADTPYVVVPNYGVEADYENIDVKGKIALVERGGQVAFTDKQAAAAKNGAVACIIYNNESGMINMQVNTGIPCVAISMADGKKMVDAAVKTLTVAKPSETITVVGDIELSGFSTWGTNPDMVLKPDMSGVGGEILSCTDPKISGSNYAVMSGTSMATPQVTGAAAVVKQYVTTNFKNVTEDDIREVVTNLMMSTATVYKDGDREYSPRAQGAGLVNLEGALSAQAYLGNPNEPENIAKINMGDDPSRIGDYDFDFTITNLSSEPQTYEFDSSINTEEIFVDDYGREFIANSPYGLESTIKVSTIGGEDNPLCCDFNDDGIIDSADARLLFRSIRDVATVPDDHLRYRDINRDGKVDEADVDEVLKYTVGLASSKVDATAQCQYKTVKSVTVQPGETLTLNAYITLSNTDKEYLSRFPNGIFVEGYLYAKNTDDGDVTDIHMPFLGFYGGWNEAPIFDSTDIEDYQSYPLVVWTAMGNLPGDNPYITTSERVGSDYSVISQTNAISEIDLGMLRNAGKLRTYVTRDDTGEILFDFEIEEIAKTYEYNGVMTPSMLDSYSGLVWDGLAADGTRLPDGTAVTYYIEGWVDGSDLDGPADDVVEFHFTVDNTQPVIQNTEDIAAIYDKDDNTLSLDLTLWDNGDLAALCIADMDGNMLSRTEIVNTPGEDYQIDLDITGIGPDFYLILGDYAANEARYEVHLSDEYSTLPVAPKPLDGSRIYGCEVYDAAFIPRGWFSGPKDTENYPSGVTLETGDYTSYYYSGEYVNGYVIAQNVDGDLELIKPTNTAWQRTVIYPQLGKQTSEGGTGYVFIDMAMDYSRNKLFGIAQHYTGKDEYERVFAEIQFDDWGISPTSIMTLDEDTQSILTLACDNNGVFYGIDSGANLWTITLEDNPEGWPQYNVTLKKGPQTSFVKMDRYNPEVGISSIQSMGYDHEEEKLYWFAESYTSYTYALSLLVEVDTKTGECTVLGDMGMGEHTGLFIPTEKTSDIFTMGEEECSSFSYPYQVLMLPGQVKRMALENINPWNAKAPNVTWTSSDETVATVDKYGLVKAVGPGTATIVASSDIVSWVDQETGETYYVDSHTTVTVIDINDNLFSYVIQDVNNENNNFSFINFDASDPQNVETVLGPVTSQQYDMETGDFVQTPALFAGGTYVNDGGMVGDDNCTGHVYAYTDGSWTATDDYGKEYLANGSVFYSFPVTVDKDGEVTIGEGKLIGGAEGVTLAAMAYDYTRKQMYAADFTNGGLGIVNLFDGSYEHVGGAATYIAMTVDDEGQVYIMDATGGIYTFDPDKMEYSSELWNCGLGQITYYSAMFYDYESDCIYLLPHFSQRSTPFYVLKDTGYGSITGISLPSVCSDYGAQQTILFSPSDKMPAFELIPVDSVTIDGGEKLGGMTGGTKKLTVTTDPERPSIQNKTWESSDPEVVSVDKYGVVTYRKEGTATITVTLANPKGHDPVKDTIEIEVYESDRVPEGTQFDAFLDMQIINETSLQGNYHDFWLTFSDNDIEHAQQEYNAINRYQMAAGGYFDGYVYGYTSKNEFVRMDQSDKSSMTVLATGVSNSSETGAIHSMVYNYKTQQMYALVLAGGDKPTYKIATVDLNSGAWTPIGEIDKPVYAITIDKNGTIYGIGSPDADATQNGKLYVITADGENKFTCHEVAELDAPVMRAANTRFHPQLTYDYTTDRLYAYTLTYGGTAARHRDFEAIMLPENREKDSTTEDGYLVVSLGELRIAQTSTGESMPGNLYLNVLYSIPTDKEILASLDEEDMKPSNIVLDYSYTTVAVGDAFTISAQISPSFLEDAEITWTSDKPEVATVDNGTVTGVSTGTAVITATSGDISVSCTVVVNEKDEDAPVLFGSSSAMGGLVAIDTNSIANSKLVSENVTPGSSVRGMGYKDGALYYLDTAQGSTGFPALMRYDLASKTTSVVTQLYFVTSPQTDMDIDPETGDIYALSDYVYYHFDQAEYTNGNNVATHMVNLPSIYQYDDDRDVRPACGAFNSDDDNFYYLAIDDTDGIVLHRVDKNATAVTILGTHLEELDDLHFTVLANQANMTYDAENDIFYVNNGLGVLYSMKLETEGEGANNVKITLTELGEVDGRIDLSGLAVVSRSELEERGITFDD